MHNTQFMSKFKVQKPFLKWVGGKTQIIGDILSKFPCEINNYLDMNHKNIKEIKVNGLLVLYNNMLKSLFSSQIKSLGFVIMVIFIMEQL